MATGKGGTKKAEQASVVPKGVMLRRRVNIQRMQNVLLIWLDNNIDQNNEDCRNTISQLRHVLHDINIYTDGDQCMQFINTITDNKVCLIISSVLRQHIVPRVHDMSQVDSIFIFCGNKKRTRTMGQRMAPRLRGFSQIYHLSVKPSNRQLSECEKNAISISFVAANTGDASSTTLDRLDPSFMYTQIVKEILLAIKFEQYRCARVY